MSGGVFYVNCEGWLHFQALRYSTQEKSLTDERFRCARTWMYRARRPGKYEIHSAMLRKYPSGTPNEKPPPPRHPLFPKQRRDTLCESRSDERSANDHSCKHDGRLPRRYHIKQPTNSLRICGFPYTMQEKRLELSWYCYHTDLNRARLPIPPFLRAYYILYSICEFVNCFSCKNCKVIYN